MRGSFKVVLAVMVTNAAIAVARFAAAILTGSSAMLSGAVHSLVDTSSQGLMLYGLMRQPQSPDTSQPADNHAELYFWSYVVAVLLFALGAGISLYEGFEKLNQPSPIESPDLCYFVLGAAILLKGATMAIALRAFSGSSGDLGPQQPTKEIKNPALNTVAIEEIAALTSLLIAFAAVAASDLGGMEAADGIASVAIGLLLGVVAALAAVAVRNLLVRVPTTSAVATAEQMLVDSEVGPDTLVTTPPGDLAQPVKVPETSLLENPPTEPGPQSDREGKPTLVSRPPHAKKGRGKRRR